MDGYFWVGQYTQTNDSKNLRVTSFGSEKSAIFRYKSYLNQRTSKNISFFFDNRYIFVAVASSQNQKGFSKKKLGMVLFNNNVNLFPLVQQ